MNKLVKPWRLGLLVAFIALLVVVYITSLYNLQIIEGEQYYEQSRNSRTSTVAVTAARGNIYDRYGRVLVSNRECYNIKLNVDALFYGDIDDPNAAILDMVRLVESCGDSYIDELPVTDSPPFEYTAMSDAQSTALSAYFYDKRADGLTAESTAVELMSYFRSRYSIDNNYSAEDMRIIGSVRYSINVRYAEDFATADYIFVEDASTELISTLMERYGDVIQVESSFVREYNTQYAAHLLGYIGAMSPAEYERYSRTSNYSLDARVGKDGVELAFESYLHGVDGTAQVTRTAEGTVVSTIYTEEPVPGSHVYLTLDIQLQEATERALSSGIATLQAARDEANELAMQEGRDDDIREAIQGGAVAVVDVNTGEPLALASYPTYNPSTLLEDFQELLETEYDPLFNRALMGAYAPGSTFKPCSAIALLTEGIINTETRVKCEGIFTKYEYAGYAPTCWIYQQGALHGNDNVVEALRDSCNFFFYTGGDTLGIDKLNEYAEGFGLGQSTGIELPEETGNMANAENHYTYAGQDWRIGDTLQSYIGQSDSLFTPLQLAEYCATIANGGTRHSASVLKTVRSYDYSEKMYENAVEILSTVESASYNWAAVQEGMYLVANDPVGSAYLEFYGYKVPVAAKTGTSQLGEDRTNNGIFICYAPYDDPQVAIAIVIERGQSGSAVAGIARDILDAYLSIEDSANSFENDNTLLK